jgi:DNA-directed RNA polymerase I subunit RPA1
MTVRDNDGSIV